jgi:hypothetical protein
MILKIVSLQMVGLWEERKNCSGSRIRFKNEQLGIYIDLHRPHPGSIMKQWMIKTIYDHLKNNDLI